VTAQTYEDIGLLTADPDIGADVAEVFNLLTGSGSEVRFGRLVVSPLSTRDEVVAAIDAEAAAGPKGRIVLKTNGLTDPDVIDALYRASAAGTPVDLVVRGRCSLRPGVPGLSEQIRVRSIVGRFLEHSRIFRFGGDAGRPLRISFGSPDLMERNLDRRVEVVVPVLDPAIQARLSSLLDDALQDRANSWVLGPDGRWTRVDPVGPDGPGFSFQGRCRTRALDALERRRGETQAVPSLRAPLPSEGPGASLSEPTEPPSAPPPPPTAPAAPAARKPRWWHRLRRRPDRAR
jgi:polyphosphate kinase